MHARNLPAAAARLVTAFVVAFALSVGFATAAFAVTTDYPPDPVSRTFSTSAGSWTGATDTVGLLCIVPITCPDSDTDYVSSGGTGGAGDGFLRSTFGGVASVLATARTEWTSPAFSYTGAGGSTPDKVFFTMDRRANAAALLAVISGARYRVFLDDQAPSTPRQKILDRAALNQPTWASAPAAEVDPGDLTVGHQYRIIIQTDVSALVGVLPTGTFDYDNVLLRANKADVTPVDTDSDGIPDSTDNCPAVANPGQADTDGDGIGDACDAVPDTDTDSDGIPDSTDNCPTVANPGQVDTDGDGVGNACDTTPNGSDIDEDGVTDDEDNCPTIPNPNQADTDGDGTGNACDTTPNGPDTDGDGVLDGDDNCPAVANAGQADSDSDGAGDACDATPNGPDTDGDGRADGVDNCPGVQNAGQADADHDGAGDACDATPRGGDADHDGVADADDACPLAPGAAAARGCPVAASAPAPAPAPAPVAGAPLAPAPPAATLPSVVRTTIGSVRTVAAGRPACRAGRCTRTVSVAAALSPGAKVAKVVAQVKRCTRGRCAWRTVASSAAAKVKLPAGRYRLTVTATGPGGRAVKTVTVTVRKAR
jgi:hypothetical protein